MNSEREQRRLEQYTQAQREIRAEINGEQANANQAEIKADPQSIDAAQDALPDRGKRFAAMDELVRGIVSAEAPYARVVTDICGPRSRWSGESFAWWIKAGGIEETGRMLTTDDHRLNLEVLCERIAKACERFCKRYGARELGKVEIVVQAIAVEGAK